MASPQERLVFSANVEGLLIRGIGNRLGPASRARFKQLGIDLDRPLMPAYPEKVWIDALELAAAEAFPGLPAAQAHFKLGESTIYGLFETIMGKSLLGMARLLGTRRSLLRFPSVSKTGTNFSQMGARELGPNEIELTSAPYGLRAEYMWGVIHAAVVVTGGKNPEVTTLVHDRAAERLVLRATWKD